jgi:hypothetical protein
MFRIRFKPGEEYRELIDETFLRAIDCIQGAGSYDNGTGEAYLDVVPKHLWVTVDTILESIPEHAKGVIKKVEEIQWPF